MIIRTAKASDAKSINEVFFFTWLSTYPNPEIAIIEEDIKEFYKDFLTDKGTLKLSNNISKLPNHIKIIVAEIEGKIVGVCRIVIKDTYNQLLALYVLPQYQKMGIGKKLWFECLGYFQKNKKIIVQVADYNHNAINFYSSLGFIRVEHLTNHTVFLMPISGVIIKEIQMEI